MNYFDFFLALDHYLLITYNIYTIYDSCWEALKEMYKLAIEYT